MSKGFLDSLDNERTKYDLAVTAQFRKDYKLAKKRGLKMEALAEVVTLLAKGEALPEKNRDHSLSGNWIGHRECHVLPDWLLIYRIEENVLVLTLTRTGTHSDLLGEVKKSCAEKSCAAFFTICTPVGIKAGVQTMPVN